MPTYGELLERRTVGPCTLLVLPTAVRDVVSVRLSIDTFPDFAAGEELVQDLTTALLEKGTARRDRFEIATLLEDRGAHIGFRSSGTRVRGSARMLSGDEAEVLALMGEMLTAPAFEPDELAKVRNRMAGGVRRSITDTGHRAAALLARHAFEPDHPGYMWEPAEELRAIEEVRDEHVARYHRTRFGGSVLCVAVGDVDTDALADGLREAFGEWPESESARRAYADPEVSAGGEGTIELPDRPNLDVRMGHALSIRRDHPDYDALHLGVFVLGGNFSARLMSRIRDEMGLTYGIGSSLSGVSTRYGGLWRTAVTLSADRLEEGIDATRRELERFVEGGVSAAEVAEMQETLAGRYVVSLATTGGLAGALLSAEERGFGVGYLDTYPDRIAALDQAQVNGAVRRWLDPTSLFVAVAGSPGDPS